MTGAAYQGTVTTEILQDNVWVVLKNGNLPNKYRTESIGLSTVNNEVFAFGNFLDYIFPIHL